MIPATTRTGARALAVGLLALNALLPGCAAGPARGDHFYRIDLPQPAAEAGAALLQGVLVVERLRSDALLSERRMLFREQGGGRVHRHAYHYWVASPPAMLQGEIASWLRAAGLAQTVVLPELRLVPDYTLSGNLRRFERVLEGGVPRVQLELELALTRDGDRTLLLLETYREERDAGGRDVEDAARALSAALGAALDRFRTDLAASIETADPAKRP